jgi:hypothetical protein
MCLSSVKMPKTECRWTCGADINLHQGICPSGLWCRVTFQKNGITDHTNKINALWRIKNINNTKHSGNIYFLYGKVKCTLVQALRLCTVRTAHRGSRGIALPFHDHGTRRGWGVSVTTRLLCTPGKDTVSIVQEAGWAPGPAWTGAENLAPTGIQSPDRPDFLYGTLIKPIFWRTRKSLQKKAYTWLWW